MDDESKQILREQLLLLKKINRHFIYERIFGTIKNIIIIGLIVFGAIQLQPYLDQFLSIFAQIQGVGQQGINLEELLKKGGF